uniref:Uncharacterized protein LOC105043883 n=1 Tax=Elaeis guineensis var. tenera TaxID=51953 RepID=A0A6I9R9Y3_ELAGV|nr:uncharacterized protein LOC105043883 [Elaeis guineensis]
MGRELSVWGSPGGPDLEDDGDDCTGDGGEDHPRGARGHEVGSGSPLQRRHRPLQGGLCPLLGPVKEVGLGGDGGHVGFVGGIGGGNDGRGGSGDGIEGRDDGSENLAAASGAGSSWLGGLRRGYPGLRLSLRCEILEDIPSL